VSEWQPIESAPKDGTKVLLFGESDGMGCISVGWYEDISQAANPDDEQGYWCSDLATETHWMPLPAPPPTLQVHRYTDATERFTGE
jgi:hypothetical protein